MLLHIFDAEKSLEAIQQHRVTVLGQIPALFTLEWNHPRHRELDLSSVRMAIYGGQSVPRSFLDRLRQMAPEIGTGLGLTELSGFCTYTALGASAEDLAEGIGFDMPLCPISPSARRWRPTAPPARSCRPARSARSASRARRCSSATWTIRRRPRRQSRRTGLCYTGDLGPNGERGLRLAGRSKLLIKPKGFQVFPGDVENAMVSALAGRVSAAACVGAEHAVWAEAIVAFVECAPDATVTAAEVQRACGAIASYARPSHVEVVPAGTLPLNRVAKTDYLALRDRARGIVEALRREGKWDGRVGRT